MDSKPERFVAYCRVSTVQQGRSGLGLEAQCSSVKQHLGSVADSPDYDRPNTRSPITKDGLRILSIRQPWAELIVAAVKHIENRTWSTRYRGPVLIHAGLRPAEMPVEAIERKFGIMIPRDLPRGGIVGIAGLADVVTASEDRFFEGPYGFVMLGARRLPFVVTKGALGLRFPDATIVTAAELIYLLRAEIKAAYGAPSLYIAAEKEYIFVEEFNRDSYRLGERRENFDLVTSIAKLTVEPWIESGYWILEINVEQALGPIPISQKYDLTRRNLTLDEFEEELSAPGQKQVSVRVSVQTPDVKQDFDRWLAKMRRAHPRDTKLVCTRTKTSSGPI